MRPYVKLISAMAMLCLLCLMVMEVFRVRFRDGSEQVCGEDLH